MRISTEFFGVFIRSAGIKKIGKKGEKRVHY